MATIGSHYFRVCTRGAERHGVSREALLTSVGIDADAIERPDWRGGVESMSLLVRAIWAALDDEHMGCTGARAPAGSLAMMTDLAFRGPTVLGALERGIGFYNLLQRGIETRIERRDRSAILTARFSHPQFDPDHYFAQFWMIIWHRFACWLAGEVIPLSFAEFDYPAPTAYMEEFKYLFPCRHRFNADACRLWFELAPLGGAIVPGEEERLAMLARAPLDFMTIPASDHSLSRRVRHVLVPAAGLPFKAMPASEIAERLAIHPAAIARQLREEGASIRIITENVRRDLASAMLRRRGVTVEAVAERLGYAEARSFTRAFKRWTGQNPLRFRRGADGS